MYDEDDFSNEFIGSVAAIFSQLEESGRAGMRLPLVGKKETKVWHALKRTVA